MIQVLGPGVNTKDTKARRKDTKTANCQNHFWLSLFRSLGELRAGFVPFVLTPEAFFATRV
jgi:hypothetical protein